MGQPIHSGSVDSDGLSHLMTPLHNPPQLLIFATEIKELRVYGKRPSRTHTKTLTNKESLKTKKPRWKRNEWRNERGGTKKKEGITDHLHREMEDEKSWERETEDEKSRKFLHRKILNAMLICVLHASWHIFIYNYDKLCVSACIMVRKRKDKLSKKL